MAPHLARSLGRRALVVMVAGLIGGASLGACSRTDEAPKAAPTAPGVEDALRAAQAAQDPLLNVSPKTFTFGALVQKPYVCDAPDACQPREGRITRFIGGETVSRTDLVKYFVNNLSLRNWQVEGVYCEPDKEQFVVLASKKADLAKGYPGRFELLVLDQIEARITIPAFGAETSFNLKPSDANYPAGACPTVLVDAFEAARAADGKPITSVPPGNGPTSTVAP